MEVQEFITLLGKALGFILIIGGLTIVFGRAVWIRWNKRWKFGMKYRVFRSKVDPIRAEWIVEALNKGFNQDRMKMKLLLSGFKNEDVYEMLYLANQFSQQLQGGKNGRKQFKRIDRENEGRKLPNIVSKY